MVVPICARWNRGILATYNISFHLWTSKTSTYNDKNK
jgi:hypothetical protein